MGLKIGFLTFTFHGGAGSSVYARAFVNSLKNKKKIDSIVTITKSPKTYPDLQVEGKAKIFNVKCLLPSHLTRYEYTIKLNNYMNVLKKENIDIIHAQHSFEGYFADRYKEKYNTPFVYVKEAVFSNLLSLYSKYVVYNIEKHSVKHLNYDILVSWTKFMVDNYFSKWKINPNRIRVIPGGINLEKFNPLIKFENIRSKYGIGEDDFLMLSVKLLSSSNVAALVNIIKAFKIFSKNHPKAKYIIVGEGKKFILKKLIDRLNLNGKVILAGRVENEKLIDFYRSSDTTLHYFVYDASISVSLMESLACGIPIITTNNGEVPNLVDDRVGVLVNQDCKEMSDAMEYLYKNENLRKKMGKSASDLAKKRFDINLIADKYVDLYEELLNRR